MSILRAVLKVASKDRKVRRLLINEIKKTAGEPSYKDYVEDKKNKGEKPLSKEDWESKVLGKGKGKGKKHSPEEVKKAESDVFEAVDGYEGADLAVFEKGIERIPKEFRATGGKAKDRYIKSIAMAALAMGKDPFDFADKHLADTIGSRLKNPPKAK